MTTNTMILRPRYWRRCFFVDRILLKMLMSQKEVSASQLLTYEPITKMCLYRNAIYKINIFTIVSVYICNI